MCTCHPANYNMDGGKGNFRYLLTAAVRMSLLGRDIKVTERKSTFIPV